MEIVATQRIDGCRELQMTRRSILRRSTTAPILKISLLATLYLMLAFVIPLKLLADPSAEPMSQTQRRARRGPRPSPTPMALPDDIKAKVPDYKLGPLPFHEGEQLIYQASWIGVPAAQAKILFHKKKKDPSRWIPEIWIETNAFADVFYKMRDYMRENIADDTLQSAQLYLVQHENARLNYYTVTFDRPSRMVTMLKENKKGKQAKEFIASNPFGPLSGAMMALTQEFAPGKIYAFDVFSGSQRYVFSFEVERRERIRLALGDFDAWRVVPDVLYLSDGNLRSQAHGTVLWISADQRRLPLRIESQAFIGTVRADLIQIDGQTSAASPAAGK